MWSRCERFARALLLTTGFTAPWLTCQAALPRYCDHSAELTAEQKDRLLRFGAIVKTELERSGASLALVSRSGLDLSRFGLRYSHAGVSLKASPNTPWSVRQLYYACDEQRPRLFDQGLAGFLFGTDDPAQGYVSVVWLPPAQADALERASRDNARALRLLDATYSANAYAWGLKYQNCNQWLIELMASAWDDAAATDATTTTTTTATATTTATTTTAARRQSQQWLAARGYEPTRVTLNHRALVWAGAFVPWLHDDDHPPAELAALRYRISMPEAIERFVRITVPQATRMEFCHTDTRIVMHRGWESIGEGCVAGPDDTVITLAD